MTERIEQFTRRYAVSTALHWNVGSHDKDSNTLYCELIDQAMIWGDGHNREWALSEGVGYVTLDRPRLQWIVTIKREATA